MINREKSRDVTTKSLIFSLGKCPSVANFVLN